MKKIRINAIAKVENADIRHIQHNGRPHIVVPSWTLPDNVVMNGGLYPADEIAASFKSLEGTFAPIGHPVVNGVNVLAGTAEAINSHYVGAWNKNVSQIDGRVYVEKWIDVEFASKFEQGQQLLEAIDKGLPIHTSTGLMCNREMVANMAGYKWVARDMQFDHDAILFDEPGAATPEEGVGLMVNSEQAAVNAICPSLTTNGVLDDSYGQRRDALSASLSERFGGPDSFVYVEDFNGSTVVYADNKGLHSISYLMEDGNAVLGDKSVDVRAKVEFVAKGANVSTEFALQRNAVQSPPVSEINPTPEKKTMDPKELAELVANSVKSAVAPLQALVDTQASALTQLQAQITANSDASDKANRDVILAKKPSLANVVNSLKGAELADLAAEFQTADSLTVGTLETNAQKTKLDTFTNYEGQ